MLRKVEIFWILVCVLQPAQCPKGMKFILDDSAFHDLRPLPTQEV